MYARYIHILELSKEFQALNGSCDESSTVDNIGKCYRKNTRRNTFKKGAKSILYNAFLQKKQIVKATPNL